MFLVTAGAINISSWVETQKQGAVGKMKFEFHPCLGHMTRCSTRFLAEVLLSEQFKGDEGKGIKEKG